MVGIADPAAIMAPTYVTSGGILARENLYAIVIDESLAVLDGIHVVTSVQLANMS